jgi:hypothetical protein
MYRAIITQYPEPGDNAPASEVIDFSFLGKAQKQFG